MDIRRMELWSGRGATMIDNDIVRLVVEDQGGMTLEFSARNATGGRENCLWMPYFRSTGVSVYDDPNSAWWHDRPRLYQLGGASFSFPDYGVDEGNRNTTDGFWMVEKYGTDPVSGGVWLLSGIKYRQERYTVRRLDLLLPGQSVRYTATSVHNWGSEPLRGGAAWSTFAGPPFLESGNVINSCARTWVTAPPRLDPTAEPRSFASGIQFDDMSHIPLGGGRTFDGYTVPPPNGCFDFITGRVPRTSQLGWVSMINPRQQMLLLSFFPGPAALQEGDLPVNFINLGFDYGGRHDTPDALYKGGTSQNYCVNLGCGTTMLDMGLEEALQKETLLGVDTFVTVPPGQTRTLYHATAFLPYAASRLGLNFYTLERVENGLQVKRTKSWAFIASDPDFTAIRKLVARLAAERAAKNPPAKQEGGTA